MVYRVRARHRRPAAFVYSSAPGTQDDVGTDTATFTESAVHTTSSAVTFPTVTVEMAFGFDPFAASPTWTDVTAYVVADVVISRGRQHELGRIETGTMSTVLTSTDDRWNAEFSGGTYWPNIKPMVPVRVRAQDPFIGSDHVVFRGFVKGFPQRWVQAGKFSRVPVRCVDAMGMFARVPMTDWESAVLADSPVGFWRFSDTSTTLTDSTNHANNHNGTIAGAPVAGVASGALEGFDTDVTADRMLSFAAEDEIVDSFLNVNDLRINGDLTTETWMYLKDQATTGTLFRCAIPAASDILYGVAVLNGTGTRDVVFTQGIRNIAEVSLNTEQWYHLVHTRESGAIKTYVDGVLTASGSAPAPDTPSTQELAVGALPGGSADMVADISELVVYDSALTAGRVRAHFNAGLMFGGGQTTQQQVTSLLDKVSWPSATRRAFGAAPTADRIPSVSIDETLAAMFRRLSESQEGTIWVERDGDVAWQTRHYRATDINTSSVTFGDGQDLGVVVFDGTAANYASAPTIAAYQVDADEEVTMRVELALDDWTPTVADEFVLRSYYVQLTSTGFIQFAKRSSDGLTMYLDDGWQNSFTDADRVQIRVDHDSSSGDLTYFTRASGADLMNDVGWTTRRTVSAWNTDDIYTGSTEPLEIGSNTANSLDGKLYGAAVAIEGVTVFDADFTDLTTAEVAAKAFTEDSAQTATVTINGSAWAYTLNPDSELKMRDLNMPHDDSMIRNIWRITPEGGVSEEVQDQTSVDSHGPREEPVDNALIGAAGVSTISQSNAAARAQSGLAKTKDATHRIESLAVSGLGQPEAWQHIIPSDLHDRIKVVRRAPGGQTVTKDAYIEHVSHRISIGKDWLTTWRLSPAETQNLCVLDDTVMAVLDDTTVLAW